MAVKTKKKYVPTEKEPFMNKKQLAYFREKLEAWRVDLQELTKSTVEQMQLEENNHPDLTDRASTETERALELRTRDRHRKLISKINQALRRIEDGTYGYCEHTGEPIGLKRLDARPIATLSVEAQEAHELREKVYRDD